MVVTLATSDIGTSNTRPSNPYKHAKICGRNFDIMKSLRGVTATLILVDIVFLVGMFFFSPPFLLFRCIMSILGYWCLYVSAFKDGNPRLMIFFIFNQFIDNIYAIFILIFVLLIDGSFGYESYSDSSDANVYRSFEIFIVTSNLLTICCKTIHMSYYIKLYKLLLWHHEHLNSIIATYTNSIICGNNIYPNPPPNILIVPGSGEVIQNNNERPPLPLYNDVVTESLPEKVKPADSVDNIVNTRIEEEEEPQFSPLNGSIDFISSSDFQQIPLDIPSIFDITPPAIENDNNEIIRQQDQPNNNDEPPPIYYISTNEKKSNDKKEYDSDEFDNPFR
uniref:Uncharacterized protein n=1 Tax=Strongyloides venezuelensis TaxID=75913 RepID=A0A0K0G1M3_STRVS